MNLSQHRLGPDPESSTEGSGKCADMSSSGIRSRDSDVQNCLSRSFGTPCSQESAFIRDSSKVSPVPCSAVYGVSAAFFRTGLGSYPDSGPAFLVCRDGYWAAALGSLRAVLPKHQEQCCCPDRLMSALLKRLCRAASC
jgi:hypothetical protein